jgi:RecA-family ATPase
MQLRSFHELVPRPLDWLWPGRLAFGKLAILDGDPGLGKSLVTLDLCARLSTGQPFPDGSSCPDPGNAIVLNAEDGAEDTVRPRLQALGADLARVFVLHSENADAGGLLRLPSQLAILDDAMMRTRARLLVIDPVVTFFDSSVQTGSDASVRSALAPLARHAAKHGCAVLLVRHLNKSGRGPSAYRGGGSIGLLGACRSGWLVARNPKVPEQCVFAQVKNNLATAQPSLAYSYSRI